MSPLALRDAIPGTEWDRWHSGTPFPRRNVAAGTQERHSRDGMGPLALRNAIPETEWVRWRSGTPFPGRNGAFRQISPSSGGVGEAFLGESQDKRRQARRGVASQLETSAREAHDLPRYGEADAVALALGREEGDEDVFRLLGRDGRAVVDDLDRDRLLLVASRPEQDKAVGLFVANRLDCVF